MQFEDALRAMREGRKVKRDGAFLEYCVSTSTKRCAMRVTDTDYCPDWTSAAFTGADIMATDWEIVPATTGSVTERKQ